MVKKFIFAFALCTCITALGMEENEHLLQSMPPETIIDVEKSTEQSYESPFANIDFSILSLDESIKTLSRDMQGIIGHFKLKQCMQNTHNAQYVLDNFYSYNPQTVYQYLENLIDNGMYMTKPLFFSLMQRFNQSDHYPEPLQKLLPKLNPTLLNQMLISTPDKFVPILIQSGADIYQLDQNHGTSPLIEAYNAYGARSSGFARATSMIAAQHPNTNCSSYYYCRYNDEFQQTVLLPAVVCGIVVIGSLLIILAHLHDAKII